MRSNKATTTYYSVHFFLKAVKNVYRAGATEIGYRAVSERKAPTAFLLPAGKTDSSDKNLRTILELLKLSEESFATKVINFDVVNVHTKILCKLSRLRHHISFSQRIVHVPTPPLYCSKALSDFIV